jgi:hypothetical protein
MSTIWVAIPEAEWSALTAFVASQGTLPFGIEASVGTAKATEGWRIVAFTSEAAVTTLIKRINDYAQTWDVPWAVPLNRILPRLYAAVGPER